MSTFNSKILSNYSTKTGVYLMKDENDVVIYVGKAKNIRSRLRQYFITKSDDRPQIRFLIQQTHSIETILVSTDKEALILENNLIKKYKPKYNILLKDDKTYIRLLITNHQWPMIKLVRQKKIKKAEGRFFGPYTSSIAAKNMLDLITSLFPLRQCSNTEFSNRSRPCILHEIKKCLAPCAGLCTHQQYEQHLKGAISLLNGQNKEIVKTLKSQMKKASENLEFEKAQELLTLIENIEHITEHQLVDYGNYKSMDIIGYHQEKENVTLSLLSFTEGKLLHSQSFHFSFIASKIEELIESFILQYYSSHPFPSLLLIPKDLANKEILERILSKGKKETILFPKKGKKKELIALANTNAKNQLLREQKMQAHQEKILSELQDMCALANYPKTTVCFDTSNIASSHPVGAAVTYIDGKYDKTKTKIFHIQTKEKGDCPALEEIITRYLTKANQNKQLCNLIVVDGGKAQLNTAKKVLEKLNIATVDLLSVCKEKALHTKGLTHEKIFLPHRSSPLIFPVHSPLLFFLQKLRDEAHRVAIGFHKKQRKKTISASLLDNVPGIGPKKKKALLTFFRNIQEIKKASYAKLKSVKELTDKDIKNIKKYL